MTEDSFENMPDCINEIFTVSDEDYSLFLENHLAQLKSNNVPEHFWRQLCVKLKNQIFDAGNCFSMTFVEKQDTSNEDCPPQLKAVVLSDVVDPSDGNNVYLIDHAWTYKTSEAKSHLLHIPGLAERMAKLMGLDLQSENLVDNVYRAMWKFNQTYSCSSLSNVEDQLPVWYIMDEFGSSIQHSDTPNFRTVPFLHIDEGVVYSLLFPLQKVNKGDDVTRDFVEGVANDEERKAKLSPWFSSSFRHIPFVQNEPAADYFLSGRRNETLPNLNALIPGDANGTGIDLKPLKVYSQYSYVNEYLTSSKFEIVTNEEQSDILWLTSHFKSYKEFSEACPKKFVNQFPYENVLTIKDLLAIVCRRAASEDESAEESLLIRDSQPSWLPTTYNLSTELPKFISYFQQREDSNLNNLWICKPWNLARGMDTLVTDNLDCIIRLSSSGPKIAQKYLESPVLFHRDGVGSVKFDVRYVILLKSIHPLELYVYKNFFLRFANKPFELDNFDDYETHFTVMNYNENATLHRLLCEDFVTEFNIQYPDEKWCSVEPKILEMFRQAFEAATSKDPPCGIGKSPQSRALYAADLMIVKDRNGDFQPKLLEINWTPDCQRACEYYPDFYNNIFELLFLDEEKEVFFKV